MDEIPTRKRSFLFIHVLLFFGVFWIPSVWCAGEVEVVSVVGETVILPCNVSLNQDEVHVILWYKGDTSSRPVFSYDGRKESSYGARYWTDPHVWGSRAQLKWNSLSSVYVELTNVTDKDQGVWRCSIEFTTAPRSSSRLFLRVIVPPSEPTITDSDGRPLQSLSAQFKEDEDIILQCKVTGGRPPPRVEWYMNNNLVDDTIDIYVQTKIINQLVVRKARREMTDVVITCQASNNNLTAPLKTSFRLDLILRPLDVSIQKELWPLVAEQPGALVCKCAGSRPPAIISWWKGGRRISEDNYVNTFMNDSVNSRLKFVPTVEDDGRIITCKATNPHFPETELRHQIRLDIHHAPLVHLRPASDLDVSNIRDGNDVTLHCDVVAKPSTFNYSWFLNDAPIFDDSHSLVTNHSLVLQRIARNMSGSYRCAASNAVGTGTSPPLQLKIMYAPICQRLEQRKALLFNTSNSIPCTVHAEPGVVHFWWTFVGGQDDDKKRSLPAQWFTNEGSNSTLTLPADFLQSMYPDSYPSVWRQAYYSKTNGVRTNPKLGTAYGTIYCWGQNPAGIMQQPCKTYLLPEGVPSPPTQCQVVNTESVSLRCEAGFTGGHQQTFVLQVQDPRTMQIKAQWTSAVPEFHFGPDIHIPDGKWMLYAFNSIGSSEYTAIDWPGHIAWATTSSESTHPDFKSYWLWWALCGSGFLGALMLAITMLWKCQCSTITGGSRRPGPAHHAVASTRDSSIVGVLDSQGHFKELHSVYEDPPPLGKSGSVPSPNSDVSRQRERRNSGTHKTTTTIRSPASSSSAKTTPQKSNLRESNNSRVYESHM